MRRFVIGTAGHIDHGKTALIRALTGVDTDRLAEEKRRGITIDLGFAVLRLDDGTELGIVDVPGHEDFIRNMLAGATGTDLVLLVVAADEGVMPQTREHLAIVELLGVRGGIVAVTKTDLVDPDWLDLVLDDLRTQLAPTPFADAPIVPVSVSTGEGLGALREAMAGAVTALDQRDTADLFRLPVDRVFTVRGTGTVVTGTVWTGQASRDQVLRVLPADLRLRARGIQVHGEASETVAAGQRAAIALAGVDRDALRRGDVLVGDDEWAATNRITAQLRVISDTDWTIRQRQRIRFHLGTAEVMGRVALLGTGSVGPGETAWAQLRLEAPVVARAGDRFVVRSYSPVTTIGGGVVAEPTAVKRKRLGDEDADALEAILHADPDAALAARARLAAWQGVAASRLPLDLPRTPHELAEALDRVDGRTIVRVGGHVFDARLNERATSLVLAAADTFHRDNPLRPGMNREELRRALPAQAHHALTERAIDASLDAGELVASGSLIARDRFSPTLDTDQQRVRDQLLDTFQDAGLTPPTISELDAAVRQRPDFWPLVRLLEHQDHLVPLTADLYAARSTLDQASANVRNAFAERPALTPADFKALFPISRKFLIPLLEYFDRAGITARRGDERVLYERS